MSRAPTGSWRGCSPRGPGGTRSRRPAGPPSASGSASSTTGTRRSGSYGPCCWGSSRRSRGSRPPCPRRPRNGRRGRPPPLLDDEVDLDVAAGRVGVGAHLVGGLHQLAAGRLVHGVRQLDAQGDLQREALALLADADLGGHRGVADVDLRLPADDAEGAAEAGGVPGGEQLLRVGSLAVAAQLHRRRQLDVDLAVVGDGASVPAVGGGGDSGVERVHGNHLSRSHVPAALRAALTTTSRAHNSVVHNWIGSRAILETWPPRPPPPPRPPRSAPTRPPPTGSGSTSRSTSP